MHEKINDLISAANRVVLGKPEAIHLALSCFFAGGHILIEDSPGMGKTTLAHTLATILGLDFKRIQFTSDLLPADILGSSIFDRQESCFTFVPGPIFAQLVMADEINRATPKTQSALLEAMEEQQATIEGQTRGLPSPFFVVATQNPSHQIGTFPLPESQLDRFLMRLHLDYPEPEAERQLLQGHDRQAIMAELHAPMTNEELLQIREHIKNLTVNDALLDYCQALIALSREHAELEQGLSPRAAIALVRCAQAWAFLQGRDYVIPEDLQAVLPAVADHRIQWSDTNAQQANQPTSISAAELLIKQVPL